MNRRELLSLIPSLSIGSVVPTRFNLRKQYMKYVFPRKYDIQHYESEGVKHYDAMYIDSEEQIQYHYYWDTVHREHRTRIKLYGEDPLDIHSVVEGETESIVEAKEELEREISIPDRVR